MRSHFVQNEIKLVQQQSEDTKDKKDKIEKKFAKLDWNTLHNNLQAEVK